MEQVSACLVTRGECDLQPIIDSLPRHWEIIVWSNGSAKNSVCPGGVYVWPSGSHNETRHHRAGRSVLDGYWPDLAVYGRYAAIEHAKHDLIYVVDDDAIVSDPLAIVDAYLAELECNGPRDCVGTERGCRHCFPSKEDTLVVCNMPPEFRHDFYEDHALVGFGAAFHRDAPRRAFERFATVAWDIPAPAIEDEEIHYVWEYGDRVNSHPNDGGWFHRTCDVVFTGLSERVLIHVPHENLPHATDDNRMYRQGGHVEERARMREFVREIREAR
jgi:hypothetical protein